MEVVQMEAPGVGSTLVGILLCTPASTFVLDNV